MEEQEFRHILKQDIKGRKGAACKILSNNGSRAQIQFEDGTTLVVSRMSLRRRDAPSKSALGNGERGPYGPKSYLG